MSVPVRLRPAARVELRHAVEWYEEQRPGLGDDLLDAMDRCLTKIALAPLAGAPWRDDVRRRRVDRFPYVVFDRVLRGEVGVVAIAHSSRRPECWNDR